MTVSKYNANNEDNHHRATFSWMWHDDNSDSNTERDNNWQYPLVVWPAADTNRTLLNYTHCNVHAAQYNLQLLYNIHSLRLWSLNQISALHELDSLINCLLTYLLMGLLNSAD